MLSTVAERLYWLGRYIERAENTARLMRANEHIALDMPFAAEDFWQHIIEIIDSEHNFFELYDEATERNVNKYMLADTNHHGSLYYSVFMARENFRTTREILPNDTWEDINDLYMFLKDNVNRAVARRNRDGFLKEVTNYCLMFTGMFESAMSHNSAYHFITIGRNLERADMTTRILDVGTARHSNHKEQMTEAFENALLMGILQSLSAFQMYQQTIKDRVSAKDVVRFLLLDEEFPRSVAYNLIKISESASHLPVNENTLRVTSHVNRIVTNIDLDKVFERDLHGYIDELQVELGRIHEQLAAPWFGEEAKS